MIGDGSLSTFEAQAIRCGERIIGGARELDLEIRAGLHTGECGMLRGDIAGLAVHIAARVSAKAGAGEVLVSRTVRDLVTGSGIVLQPTGTHALKGVPGTCSEPRAGFDSPALTIRVDMHASGSPRTAGGR